LRSRPFAWPGRRRIDGAIRCRQLQPNTSRRTAYPHLFSVGGCELLVVLLGPWGAFTEPASTSDTLVVTRRHARPASVPTDALSAFAPPKWNGAEIHLRAEGLQRRLIREDKTGQSPRMPSVVSRTCEPKPTSRTSQYFFNYTRCSAHRFAFSPLVPASGGASSFLLASALPLQQALRPPGGQDARCVRPTSATQTNYVYPYLVRSRLTPRLSPRGHPTESWAP